MKRLLIAVMMLTLVSGLVAGGVMAQFSDTDTSTGNTFTAGYEDLCMSTGGGYSNNFTGPVATASNMAPGVEVGPYQVYFKNCGSIDGAVAVTLDYSNSDVAPQGEYTTDTRVSADAFAKKLIVPYAKPDFYLSGNATINVAPYWALQVKQTNYSTWTDAINAGAVVVDSDPGNPVGYLPTIYGLSEDTPNEIVLGFTNGYGGDDFMLQPGQAHYEEFKMMLAADAGNEYMFDGISINFIATLDQGL